MNTSQGQDINEKIFDKLSEIELKKKGKQVEKLYPEVIKRAFPNDQIVNEYQAVKHLREATNLEENVIREGLSNLIGSNDLIPSKDSRGRLHLAKFKKLY